MSADKSPSIFSRQMEAIFYIFPNFQNCARCKKDLKDNKDNSLHLGRKYAKDICPWTLSVPRSEQIMSATIVYLYLCLTIHEKWVRQVPHDFKCYADSGNFCQKSGWKLVSTFSRLSYANYSSPLKSLRFLLVWTDLATWWCSSVERHDLPIVTVRGTYVDA